MPDNEEEKPIAQEHLHEIEAAEAKIVAAVPKDAFKAMFYLFAGKPDSRLKLYKRKIQLHSDDIHDLNQKIREKLNLHSIDQVISTCVIDYQGDNIVEFGTWAELLAYDWKNPNVTDSVTLKWDFMIKLNGYAAPQRHTLTVKISSPMKPQEMFRLFVSGALTEDEEVDHRAALCTGRVDFISHRLADELLEVVRVWNEALRQPKGACGLLPTLERFDSWIARGIHLFLPLIGVFLALGVLDMLNRGWTANDTSGHDSGIAIAKWLLISIVSIFSALRISHFLAGRIYGAINSYGAYNVFNLTRGDENAAKKADEANRKALRSFWWNAGLAIVLNVVAGIVTWWILPKSGS